MPRATKKTQIMKMTETPHPAKAKKLQTRAQKLFKRTAKRLNRMMFFFAIDSIE